jgi:hypothetical protein
MRQLALFLLFCLYVGTCFGQANYKIGKLKYGGGGDWYANKTSLPNLIQFCNQTINTRFDPDPQVAVGVLSAGWALANSVSRGPVVSRFLVKEIKHR